VVIPVKDALRGEAPKAVIALKDGCSLSQAELRRRLEGLLHRHKIPRHIEFVSELPRTPGGKIAWRKLS
jgi:long-chain acyl-CoA synthetase